MAPLYGSGRCLVSASLVSYMWLSASNTGMSRVGAAIGVSLLGRSEDAAERRQVGAGAVARGDELVTGVADRHDAQAHIGDARVGEAAQALLDGRLAAGGQQVAHVPGVAEVEELLVVRRHLCLGEDAVGAGDRVVDLVVTA